MGAGAGLADRVRAPKPVASKGAAGMHDGRVALRAIFCSRACPKEWRASEARQSLMWRLHSRP